MLALLEAIWGRAEIKRNLRIRNISLAHELGGWKCVFFHSPVAWNIFTQQKTIFMPMYLASNEYGDKTAV